MKCLIIDHNKGIWSKTWRNVILVNLYTPLLSTWTYSSSSASSGWLSSTGTSWPLSPASLFSSSASAWYNYVDKSTPPFTKLWKIFYRLGFTAPSTIWWGHFNQILGQAWHLKLIFGFEILKPLKLIFGFKKKNPITSDSLDEHTM